MLARDLLEQAKDLLESDPRRPRQVNLRRAISSAYYGLFHLLTGDASNRLVRGHHGLREVFARSFDHGDLKKICGQFGKGQLPTGFEGLLPSVSPKLKSVALTFVELQAARHDADYNLRRRFSRSEAAILIQRAETAFSDWYSHPWNKEADVFVVAMVAGRKSRGV